MFLHIGYLDDTTLDLEVKFVSLISNSCGYHLYYELLFDDSGEGDSIPVSNVFSFSITNHKKEI